jgi:uncharacterized protein (TIGR02145 family)
MSNIKLQGSSLSKLQLTGTSYHDWYLPSIDESREMYDELHLFGLGNFSLAPYWTSSEAGIGTNAYALQFTDRNATSLAKSQTKYVRQIRSFTAAIGAYSLRDTGPANGLIFYTDGAGLYLEAALSDLSTSQVWSNVTSTLIGTTGTAIGSGNANTLAIINQNGHINSAALLTNQYSQRPISFYKIKLNNNINYDLTDLDGNIYTTIIIGSQEWIIQNYRSTKYADGSTIPLVEDSSGWIIDINGAMCYYNNDIENKDIYGALYNWYVVDNSISYLQRNNIQEIGWRVPTDSDFSTLLTELGGDSVAGGKMKEIGIVHWQTPNTGATNESGFTALGSGNRNTNGTFGSIMTGFLIWSADQVDATKSNWGLIAYNSIPFDMHPLGFSKSAGFAIRLVRDI